MTLKSKDLMAEFRLQWDGDAWGDTMNAWFNVAGWLYNVGEQVPASWKYRPSPVGEQEVDPWWQECFDQSTPENVLRFGRAIHRYAKMLEAAGKDY